MQKTEEPTPRRLEQSRRKGQIVVSQDLNSGFGAAAACVALVALGPSWAGGLVGSMRTTLATAASARSFSGLVQSCLQAWIMALLAPVGAIIGMVILVGLAQTQGLFSLARVRLDLGRLVPARDRLVGRDAWAQAGWDLTKIAVVALVGYWSIRGWTHAIMSLGGAGAARILLSVGEMGKILGLRLAVATVALGCVDYGRRSYRHRKSLRMSRDEARREHKETEGEPAYRTERQRLHREILQQHALAEVESADLVVVGEGAVAVAVRYDRAGPGSPVVLVKGERRVAQMVEELARSAGVPIVEDILVARALGGVEEGGEIPAALYEQVAELLVGVGFKGKPSESGIADRGTPRRGQGPPQGSGR
jgi:flagellar biosynthesis protein FlhB